MTQSITLAAAAADKPPAALLPAGTRHGVGMSPRPPCCIGAIAGGSGIGAIVGAGAGAMGGGSAGIVRTGAADSRPGSLADAGIVTESTDASTPSAHEEAKYPPCIETFPTLPAISTESDCYS
ncbi:MAG: hypothetical protein AB7P20_27880 [Rhizobiaceae bacterium]